MDSREGRKETTKQSVGEWEKRRHFIGSGSVLMVLGPVSAPIFWYVNGVSHSGNYFDLSRTSASDTTSSDFFDPIGINLSRYALDTEKATGLLARTIQVRSVKLVCRPMPPISQQIPRTPKTANSTL